MRRLLPTFTPQLATSFSMLCFTIIEFGSRGDGTAEADTVSIDEGLAHLMEDMLGYGALNFDDYAATFLTQFAAAASFDLAIFDETQSLLADENRGAAQTLFYYLVSQQGGVSFNSGKPNGGGGLDFIRSFISNPTRGVAGIEAALGSNWSTTFSNYLEALNLNNTNFSKASINSRY